MEEETTSDGHVSFHRMHRGKGEGPFGVWQDVRFGKHVECSSFQVFASSPLRAPYRASRDQHEDTSIVRNWSRWHVHPIKVPRLAKAVLSFPEDRAHLIWRTSPISYLYNMIIASSRVEYSDLIQGWRLCPEDDGGEPPQVDARATLFSIT